MSLSSILVGLACILVAALVYFMPAAWAVGDAQKRGQGGGVVVVLLGLFGPFGALVWLLTRPPTKVVERIIDDYIDADDALGAAASLDQLGEWDTAIRLYQHVAQRWPGHRDYAATCIKQIQDKQAMA